MENHDPLQRLIRNRIRRLDMFPVHQVNLYLGMARMMRRVFFEQRVHEPDLEEMNGRMGIVLYTDYDADEEEECIVYKIHYKNEQPDDNTLVSSIISLKMTRNGHVIFVQDHLNYNHNNSDDLSAQYDCVWFRPQNVNEPEHTLPLFERWLQVPRFKQWPDAIDREFDRRVALYEFQRHSEHLFMTSSLNHNRTIASIIPANVLEMIHRTGPTELQPQTLYRHETEADSASDLSSFWDSSPLSEFSD